MKNIRIGTRDSRLALRQAEIIKNLLIADNPDTEFTLVPMKTKGDKILDRPLPRIGDKGLFTRELECGLLEGQIDMAVHSLKDLPTELPDGLKIAAYSERMDPRDVFIGREGLLLSELPEGSLIGTSSLRRMTQLQYYRQDLSFCDLRGNLETRWRKLQESSDMAGIVLAAAGVIRLGWQDRITEYLSEDIIFPAVGQGIIAVEIASKREDNYEIIEKINDRESEFAARAERAFLKNLQGGCQVPIGALATVNQKLITLRGMVAGPDGSVILQVHTESLDPETAGIEAAEKISNLGARELLAEIRRQTGI